MQVKKSVLTGDGLQALGYGGAAKKLEGNKGKEEPHHFGTEADHQAIYINLQALHGKHVYVSKTRFFWCILPV